MKIEFHYTYLIVALGFIITGYFSNLLVFTSIILIHEIGHYLTASYYHQKVNKITIYPYGGLTEINTPINTPIKHDLLVAISGVAIQIIYYSLITILYQQGLIRQYIYQQFTTYHYSILIFNLLPIHPLDGSKILTLILSKLFPYKITLKINIITSIITIIILLITKYYKFNYTTILIISLIITSITKYYHQIDYLFNKFLLERYLYKITYHQNKKISHLNNMYKEKYHIIKENNHYITEKQALKARFSRKY